MNNPNNLRSIPLYVRKAAVKVPSFMSQYHERIKYLDEYIPSVSQVRIQWNSRINDAQRVWNKLTKSDLLEVKGQKFLLVEMIQKRHATPRDEANKQVNKFFETYMS